MRIYYRALISTFLILALAHLNAMGPRSKPESDGTRTETAPISNKNGSDVSGTASEKQASQSAIIRDVGAQKFLYVGLVENQWQVFSYDFTTEQSEQLTFSPGDKRRPQYHAASDSIYFKDSQGWIVRLNSDGTEMRISDKGRIAEFCPIPNVNALLYTCLIANNPQRQVLWRLDIEDDAEPQLLKRMPVGSLRQIAVKSNNEYIVSHIAKRREEQLYFLEDSGEGHYVTPKKAVSIYPSWDEANQRVLFAGELADGSYDLFTLDLVSGESEPFLQTEGASEFTTSVSPDGTMVLVEQHVHGVSPRIAIYDFSASVLTPIQLEHPAKEPFWYP